jgi:PAS domain S-box-containing protein
MKKALAVKRQNGSFPSAAGFDPLAIFDSMSHGVMVVDRDWRIIYLNAHAIQTLGQDRNLAGKNLWQAFPGSEFGKLGTIYKTAMAQGIAIEADELSEALCGWVSVNTYPMPDGLAIFFRKASPQKVRDFSLLSSQRRFHIMFETLTQGVMFQDTAGTVLELNPAAERILGISRAEIIGKTARDPRWQVCDEDGEPLALDKFPGQAALVSGRAQENVILQIFHRGLNEKRWLRWDSIPHYDEFDNSPKLLCSIFNDITDQKRSEMALRESQTHLALAQRVASVGSSVLDFRKNALDWSEQTYKIFGFEKEKFTPTLEALIERIHPDDRAIFQNGIELARRGLEAPTIDFRITRPDGQFRILRRTSELIRNESGEVVGFLATDRDITEQKQAETALRQSQAHLALAQRVAGVGSTIIDFSTGEWEWSDETYRIFGVSKSEYRGIFRQTMERAKTGVTPYPMEFRITTPDGVERIFYHEADLIRDDNGTVTGAITTCSDITDLRVAEKQRELFQNQLYHVQRLDSLGTLAGGIAHDLNNTLVPILGLSEAMIKGLAADSPQRHLIEIVYQAGIRARDLVRQILTFSRRENPDSRVLDLSAFLRETMRLVRASVPTTITIEEKITNEPQIIGDASQLHQVILNLTANAAQAIGDNLGTICVEVTNCGKNTLDEQGRSLDSFVRISVKDTGAGMEESTQKRIFEPFFTTKQVGVGTGLGLSVVHGIVAAHGGRIQVSSKLGEGTQFDVFLPVVAPESGQPKGDGVAG